MTDYISRQAAIDALCVVCSLTSDYRKCNGYPEESTWCDEVTALRRVPSADVTEVVRCKDCEHWTNDDCPFSWGKVEDAFCSYGERREDG